MSYSENVIIISDTDLSAGQASAPVNTASYSNAYLYLRGTSDLSVTVEGLLSKNPGASSPLNGYWLPVQSALAPGFSVLDPLPSLIRLRVLAGTLNHASMDASNIGRNYARIADVNNQVGSQAFTLAQQLLNSGPTLSSTVPLTSVGPLLALEGIQAALYAKAAAGGGIFSLDSKTNYLMTGDITIPTGVHLQGQFAGNDSSKKGTTLSTELGTVIRMRNAPRFMMEPGSKISNLVEYYDQQNYAIVPDVTQPDGLSPFVSYPVTHLFTGTYSGAEIDNIVYLGGSRFAETATGKNPEKFRITNIAGMFTECFLKVPWVTDIPMVSNCFFNANSLYGILGGLGISDTTNLHTKLAKNAVLFRLGRTDDIDAYRIFAYGVKTWLETRNYGDSRDDGTGGGATFTACAGDGVAYAVDHGRSNTNGFGYKFTNTWFTPLVKKWIENGVAVSALATPALLIFRAGAKYNLFQFNNTTVFGGAVPQITDSGLRVADFLSSSDNAGNIVQVSNFFSANASVLHDGSYAIGNNDASKPRLAGEVVFNGNIQNLSGTPEQLRGSFLGASPANGTVVGLYTVARNGNVLHGTGQGRAITGPTAGGATITFTVAGRQIGVLAFAAGATSSDPLYAVGFDTHVNTGDVVVATASGLAGAANLSWSLPIFPAF